MRIGLAWLRIGFLVFGWRKELVWISADVQRNVFCIASHCMVLEVRRRGGWEHLKFGIRHNWV
jgi:hypothetical protein